MHHLCWFCSQTVIMSLSRQRGVLGNGKHLKLTCCISLYKKIASWVRPLQIWWISCNSNKINSILRNTLINVNNCETKTNSLYLVRQKFTGKTRLKKNKYDYFISLSLFCSSNFTVTYGSFGHWISIKVATNNFALGRSNNTLQYKNLNKKYGIHNW